MNQQILKTPAAELIPDPKVDYVDVHNILGPSLDMIIPDPSVPSANLLLNSPHGLGKTLMAAVMAKNLGKKIGSPVPMIVFDCSEDTREYDLVGMPTVLADGTTAFQLGPFPLALELANECGCAILLAEEISALPPGAQKSFNRMTDWRSGIYVSQVGRMFRLDPGATLVVMGTMNPAVYGGVYSLNQDLRSRFSEVRIPAPTQKQMEQILKSVCPWANPDHVIMAAKLASESRSEATEYSLSTRDMVQLLQTIHRANGVVDFPLRLIVNKFEDSEMNTMADRVDAIFATNIKKDIGTAAAHV